MARPAGSGQGKAAALTRGWQTDPAARAQKVRKEEVLAREWARRPFVGPYAGRA